jgi:hypothetical protein
VKNNGNEKPRNVGLEIEQTDFDSAIKVLQEESRQMVELVEIEKAYAAESVVQLKRIIEPLGVSFNVRDAWNTSKGESVDKAVLTPEGMVCVIYTNGTVQTKPLERIRSDALLKIMSIAIPEVKQCLVERRQITSLRAGVLERIAKELGKVSSESDSDNVQQMK